MRKIDEETRGIRRDIKILRGLEIALAIALIGGVINFILESGCLN